MDVDVLSGVVLDKAELPESVHEKADARTSCSHHFRQSCLTESGNRHFGHTFRSETCHQQKNARQSLFAGIEKLVDQIILVSDIPPQEVLHEQSRQFWLQSHFTPEGGFLDIQKNAICQGRRGRHAYKLTGEAAFSEKVAHAQDSKNSFSTVISYYAQPYLAGLDEKQSIHVITLSENLFFFRKRNHSPPLANTGKKRKGIEIACFLLSFDSLCHSARAI